MGSRTYLLLTLCFYAVGAFYVFAGALTRRRLITSVPGVATLAGFAAHTAGLSQRWTEAGHFPAVGVHDLASFLAWAVVLAFLMTYVRTGVDALGLVVYPVAFLLVVVANLSPASESERPVLKSLYLPVHTTFALVGYGALFVACAMAVLYLIQERELKARSPNSLYYLLPSLERCDTIGGRSVALGLAFLTLAILTGLMWSRAARGHYFTWDAKELSAVGAWFTYVAVLWARSRSGWGGKRAAYLGIAGFGAVILTFVYTALIPGAPPSLGHP